MQQVPKGSLLKIQAETRTTTTTTSMCRRKSKGKQKKLRRPLFRRSKSMTDMDNKNNKDGGGDNASVCTEASVPLPSILKKDTKYNHTNSFLCGCTEMFNLSAIFNPTTTNTCASDTTTTPKSTLPDDDDDDHTTLTSPGYSCSAGRCFSHSTTTADDDDDNDTASL
eukprot:scaffold25453_cov171-Cylindrotheca_fusiformis.AAC.1